MPLVVLLFLFYFSLKSFKLPLFLDVHDFDLFFYFTSILIVYNMALIGFHAYSDPPLLFPLSLELSPGSYPHDPDLISLHGKVSSVDQFSVDLHILIFPERLCFLIATYY